MKINIQNILLAVLVGLLAYQFFFQKDEEPKPIQVIIPPIEGSTGTQIIEHVKTIPVYIEGQGQVIVDERWRNEYLNSKDSIERLNQYLKAIQVKEKEYTFIDNDTIKIDGTLKTRGDLLEYKLDYQIKERIFEYTPEVVYKRPRISLEMAVKSGIPTNINSNFIMKGELGLKNKNGFGLNLGYDTDNRIWAGISKDLTLLK